MKQIDLRKQTKSRYPDTNSSRWRLWCMMLLALLATNASLLAQMNWESGYPKLTPGVLTVEGDEGLLEIYMTTSAEVSNAQFTITIPDNMSCPGVVSENAIAYSAPAVANGKATIRVTSNGGTLPAGSTVHFKVKLKALCGVVSNGSLVVTPLSGTTTAVGDVKSEVFQTQVPSIQMTTTNKTVPYTTPDTFQPVSYKLSSMNGDAKAFKINLVVDEYTTLQTFVYGGTSITPVISADKKTYTLNLTDLSSTEKTLSFEGASSMFGNHLITPTVQYPSAKNCATVNGHVVTLSSPTIVGLPYMTRTSSAYVEDNKTTVIARADVKVDGSTRTWTKFVYENTGEVEAWNIKVVLRSQGGYTYIEDVNEIYYQLGSGALIKMPSEWITSTTIVESAPSRTYKSTVEGKTKVVSFSIPKTIKLGVNETITFYAPTINGEIYDNTVVGYYNSSYTHQFLSSEIYVTATNGAGVAGNQTANGGLHWNDISAFAKMPASFSIRQGASIIQEIPLVRGASKMKVSVKLPSWLKLDNSSGDPFVWTSSDKTYSAVENEADLTADPPYKVYTTNTWNANDIITFKYKADGFPSTESNKEGTISYWMDYDYNGQILTKIYHVTQSVTLLCEEDGAVLEDFSVYRKTRGLQDSDNNRIPDAPTADAKDGEMDMTKYLVGDKGEFRWKVRIANGASYPHLYLPVTTNDISSANIELLPTEATVSGSSIVTVEQPSANTFYVRIDGTLVGGQTVDIALPFVAKSQNAKQGSLISGCFVTNNPLDPFDSSNLSERKGKDSQDRLMGVYTFGNGMSMSSGILEFNSTDAEKKEFRPYIFAGASSLAPPYFINEVRRIYYPLSIIWELPDGYQLYGQKMVVNRAISDTQGPATKEPTVVIDGNTYTFDMASLYNTDVDSNENSLSLDDWALSDDTWSQYVTFYIQATKGVTYGSSEAKATILWKNLQTGAEETSVSAKGFYYNGLSTDLQLSTNQLYSYGSSLNIPRLSVGTPKGALDRVWVYVDGNVNNLKLTNVDGGAITNGSGAGNRWLEITTTGLAAGNVKEYTFDFNYLGRTDGKNEKDTIVIYTVSDFGDATFQDPTASALDPTDTDHVGALRRLVIIPGEARVTGSLSVDDPALTYNTPYTLTATIDGTVSPGMLRNPQIEIKIPKGQEYIPGTLSLNYAGSTAYNLSSLETVLTTDNTNSTFGPLAERTFVFSLKDILGTDVIMPGYLSSDLADTDAKRIATLTADFKPMCNTILTGIRFNGEIEAENLNTSLGRFSQSLTPANLKSYTFDVTAEVDGGNLAFNEGQTDKTLKVTIKKTVGLSAIDATDYIQLEMPAMINLKGVGTIASGAISGINGSITVDENDDTTTPGSRVIRLALPVSTINLDGDKGFNKEIVYEIPITYTVSASDGVQLIEAKYISSASFDSDCTSGAVTLGSDDVEVAILTALTDPYVVSVDESVTLGMSTTNFTGKWYSDASLSTEVSATNSYTYTPTSTETGEQTFYVSAIINGTDYGKVPVKVMVYPSLTFAVTDAAICPAGSIDLSTLVSGDAVASGTTTVLKYYESNQTTLLGSSTVSPSADTDYYIQSETHDGALKGSMEKVTITLNTPITIGSIAPAATNLELSTVSGTTGSTAITVSGVTGTKNASDEYTYQLYLKGSPDAQIGADQTNGSFTVSAIPTVGSTEASKTYTYYAKVQGACDAVNSSEVSVTVYPLPVITPATGKTFAFCSGDAALTTGINLDSYLDPATVNTTWFTYTYSTDGGTNYSPLTSSVTLATAVGTTTYTLRAQNTLTGSLEEATTDVVITVNPAVAIGTDLNTTKVTETINLSPIRTATLTVVATGTGYTYQWYKSATNAYAGTAITDGTAYAGATTDELTITFNTTDITGFYYLVVTDACGNTVNSAIKEIEAIDKPDDVVLLTTTDNRKACLLTDAIPVEFTYSNTYSNGETIWYNNADDTSTAYPYTVGSSTIVLNSWGDNTIYVWAKNPGASGNFSDQADTYTINLTQYTAVTLANLADIELEAAAGANATATITATASGDADPLSGAYTYSLYAGTNPTAVDGPTAATGANTFAGQSVAAPALTYTTADHLAYTFKVVATGACSPAAEKTVNVKVYPTPVVTLDGTKDVAFCNATAMTINLWNYLDTPNAVLFDYEYSEDGTTYNSLASSTTVSVPANGTAKTIKLRAKNKKATPTVSTAVDLSLTVNVPVTALVFDPAEINLEGATSTTITVPVPTVGTKDASGNYNYILYNSDNTPAASTQTTNVFTSIALTAPLTTESHSSQSYYATIQGASTCNAVPTPNNVTVNVYPVPTLSLATTTDAYCEDNTALVAGIDLWSYINTPNTTWFTYTYSGNGVTDGALAAGTVTIPTQPGTYTYTIKAVNKLATSTLEATETITIKVDRQTKITKQPTSVVVTEWDAFTLSVEAVAEGAITYQWEKWNTYLQVFETVPGATSATYVVNRSVAKDAGLYRVVVTGGKGTACGKKVIPSDEVNVQVNPNGLCQITYASSEEGELVITDTDGNVITSGTYVVPGTKVKAMATARTAGYDLWQLVANGTVIDNNSTIEIAGHTHFFAHFTLDGKNPNPGVGNVEVTDGSAIWTNKGYVHILTEKPCKARIITFTGRVLIDRAISEGETQIYMPEGLYIVTLSDGTREKVSVKY